MLKLLWLVSCAPDATPWARAYQIESLDETVGGPKALARPGDFVLENDRIRVAVIGGRRSLGPSPMGGTIADVDLQRLDARWSGGHGNDQFAEMFATVNMNLSKAEVETDVSIVEGDDAVVRVDAMGTPFLSLLGALWVLPSVKQPDFRITTDYVLAPGSPALKIVTTASFTSPPAGVPASTLLAGSTGSLPVLELALDTGLAFGDFFLQGGSVDVFSPGIGFDEDGAVYEANAAGRNTFDDPFEFEFLAGVADGVSYGLASTDGSLFVPLFTSSQTAAFGAGQVGDGSDDRFAPGASYRYERWLAVGKGDVGSVLDALLEVRGLPSGNVRGYVVEEATGVALPGISVLAFRAGEDGAYNQWLTDVGEDTQPDGSFGGRLPPGDYELLVHAQGRPDGPRVPVTVAEGGTVDLVLSSPRAGQVSIDVVDETGRALPSKITFQGGPGLNPDYGDPYIAGNPAEVVFAPDGHADVVLPPGTYTAVASRGLEYELAVSDPIHVTATGVNRLRLQCVRSVDSEGWISADLHVHAVNSHDSGTLLTERVVTMVAEGVEFFTSNDHDYLVDYAPTVEDLGLEEWVKTSVGLETTTLELGHFLGFPLGADTAKDAGGAFEWSGMTADEILDTLTELGVAAGYEPLVFVAHPRDGILGYFDQFGFDPYTGEYSTPIISNSITELREGGPAETFDALELLNAKRFEIVRTPTQPELDAYAADPRTVDSYDLVARTGQEQSDLNAGVYRLGYGHEGQVDDWFTLLNLGRRYTALGNSDTHDRFHTEAGCPRNYVESESDDPAYLDEQAVADAIRAGKVVASYGPFIRFTVDGQGLGSEVVDTDGAVDLSIEVQAPTWIAVDRVELYRNGTLIHEWEGLDPDVYRLVEELSVPVDKDSWFVVVAIGDGDLSPVFTPVEMPPVQLQDVVSEALADVSGIGSFLAPAVPIPRTGVVVPYAITNPIYVDVDGAGWVPPGLPTWLQPPVEPVE